MGGVARLAMMIERRLSSKWRIHTPVRKKKRCEKRNALGSQSSSNTLQCAVLKLIIAPRNNAITVYNVVETHKQTMTK